MKRALLLILFLAACRSETEALYDSPDRVWTLKTLNGVPFAVPATLSFPKAGEISGSGPCNSYFGALAGPYPAFTAGPIGSTRRACPELTAETLFFEALQTATTATVIDETLVLSNPSNLEMVFTNAE